MSQDKNNTPETQDEPYEGILGDFKETEEEAPSEQPEKKKKSRKSRDTGGKAEGGKTKTAAIVCVAAAVILLGGLGYWGVTLMKDRELPAPSGPSGQSGASGAVAAASDSMEISKEMMACYFKDTINMYADYYGAEMLLSYYQLDITQSLKDQMYPVNDGTTWFYQIMEQTKQTVSQQLMVAEAGKAAGFALTEEVRRSVEEELAEYDISTFGNGITVDDLRNMLLLQNYSLAYFDEYSAGLVYSDEELEAYYNEHKNSFDTCNIAVFSIPFVEEEETPEEDAASEDSGAEDTDGESTEDENAADEENKGLTQEQAKALADALAETRTTKAFEEKAGEILTEHQGYSEEEAEAALASIFNEGYYYTEGSSLAEWAFGGAKVGETFVVEGDTAYYIYMLTSEPGRDESSTVNVRHILFTIDGHTGEDGDTDAALAECWKLAEECLDEWKNGEQTEDSFAALATSKTEDPGSQSTGGLYENVYVGQMVQPFEDWCFDTSRKPGDTGLVETSYGVHVMYFSDNAGPLWKNEIKSTLMSEAVANWFTELGTLYPVTFDDDVINSIEG